MKCSYTFLTAQKETSFDLDMNCLQQALKCRGLTWRLCRCSDELATSLTLPDADIINLVNQDIDNNDNDDLLKCESLISNKQDRLA